MTKTTPNPVRRGTAPFLKVFQEREHSPNLSPSQPDWIAPVRKTNINRFVELGFPTLKHEDWRFTSVVPLVELPLQPASPPASKGLPPEDLLSFPLAELPGSRLVFVDGRYNPGLSVLHPDHTNASGLIFGNLADAITQHPALVEQHLTRYLNAETDAFAALNNALFDNGGFVHVASGCTVDMPIQFLFVSTDEQPGSTTHPRNLIIAEPGSRVTVTETYVSTTTISTFTNAVTEFALGDNCHVEHCKFQDENPESFHVAALPSVLGKDVRFSSHSFITGARLCRNNIRTTLNGTNSECVLNGIYLTNNNQLADHHMIVDHAQPNCASHEYFNGILAGHSRGVFHGRILVRPGAQKTDAKQTNKNLLLSDDACVDTKPQLEIYADDVKCTHGATIGQLNAESIYYLRSRGIGLETARRMLIHAFAGEIIDRVEHEALRKELDALLWERLEQQESIAVGIKQ